MMKVKRLIATLTFGAWLVFVPVSAADLWLHVHVEEDGEASVNVNLPLSVAQSMLPAIEMDELSGGTLRIDDADFDGIDLRQILVALQDAPDAEFVTVRSDDESVRVAKERGTIVIRVEERGDSGENVLVRVPMDVVEALVGSRPGELDLLAGLRALAGHEGEDLVTVEADGGTVRVWVDSRETQ